MMEFIQLLASLRPAFAAWSLAAGSAVVAIVLWLNDGDGTFHDPSAGAVAGTAAALLAAWMFGARWNRRVRALVLRPDAKLSHAQLGLEFLGVLGAVFAVAFFAMMHSMLDRA
jgi:hypothetical protein